jgi:hypothetical protein
LLRQTIVFRQSDLSGLADSEKDDSMGVSALSRFGRVLAYSRAMGPTRALPWALALVVVCTATPASALPILSISGPSAVTAGQTFSVDIGVGLIDPTDADDVFDLVAFQLGILFDPALLQVGVATEGGFLSSDGGTTAFIPGVPDPNAPNTLPFLAGVLEGSAPGVNGSGILLSLQFLALATGVSPISIVLDPTFGDGLYDSVGILAGVPIDGVTTVPFSVTVAAPPTQGVPEPGTLLMLGLGAGLATIHRRRARVSRH